MVDLFLHAIDGKALLDARVHSGNSMPSTAAAVVTPVSTVASTSGITDDASAASREPLLAGTSGDAFNTSTPSESTTLFHDFVECATSRDASSSTPVHLHRRWNGDDEEWCPNDVTNGVNGMSEGSRAALHNGFHSDGEMNGEILHVHVNGRACGEERGWMFGTSLKEEETGGLVVEEHEEYDDDHYSTAFTKKIAQYAQPLWFHSSLKTPFLVISPDSLVEDIPALEEDEFSELVEAVEKYIEHLANTRAVVLADFEGEMPGFGGELVTACFQETLALHKETLQVLCPETPSPMPGLFIDLRNAIGIRLVSKIMSSPHITKIIWGAEGDLTSLRFQYLPREMSIKSENVVDAQLAFSAPSRRLGMARILGSVPPHLLKELPGKDVIDFDTCHAKNQRALPLPLTNLAALYSVDDLHRLEAILRSKLPPSPFSNDSGYRQPRDLTTKLTAELEHDRYGIAWLEKEEKWFRKMKDNRRGSKAVQMKRHIKQLHLRNVELSPAQEAIVKGLDLAVTTDLRLRGVYIDDSLNWAVPHT